MACCQPRSLTGRMTAKHLVTLLTSKLFEYVFAPPKWHRLNETSGACSEMQKCYPVVTLFLRPVFENDRSHSWVTREWIRWGSIAGGVQAITVSQTGHAHLSMSLSPDATTVRMFICITNNAIHHSWQRAHVIAKVRNMFGNVPFGSFASASQNNIRIGSRSFDSHWWCCRRTENHRSYWSHVNYFEVVWNGAGVAFTASTISFFLRRKNFLYPITNRTQGCSPLPGVEQ